MTDENDVIPLRRDEDGKLEAADWLAKLDKGDLTETERVEFARWIAEDPANKIAIRSAASFWYGLNAPLSALTPAFSSQDGTSIGLLQALGVFLGTHLKGVAAGAVVLLVGTVLTLNFAIAPQQSSGYYTTDIGETRTIALDDGSQVHLNTNSIVEHSFTKETRIIRLLSGEAIFDVAHDKKRPFVVYAADGIIRAVGTRFGVRVVGDQVRVTVTEGTVALETRAEEKAGSSASKLASPADLNPILVSQGEAANIDRAEGRSKRTVTQREVLERLSWAQGNLVFYDEELQSVINEVARYTTVRISVLDEALKGEKITGILQIGNVDMMLEGIEASLGVKVDWIAPDSVHLTAQNKGL